MGGKPTCFVRLVWARFGVGGWADEIWIYVSGRLCLFFESGNSEGWRGGGIFLVLFDPTKAISSPPVLYSF